MDNGDCGPGAQRVAPDLHDKMQKITSFEKVSYDGRVLRNASAMIAEREALRKGIEHLTVLFPTVVSSLDFQVECTDRTVQYKLNAQSLRLFGLHRDVNDAHRAGAKSSPKQKTNIEVPYPEVWF